MDEELFEELSQRRSSFFSDLELAVCADQLPVSIPKAVQSADRCQATEREMGAAWCSCKIEKQRFAEKTESGGGVFDISWL